MKKRKNTVADAGLLVAAAVLACLAVCSSAAGETVVGYSNESARRRRVVPAIYVFGDSLVDVGNNNFLPPPAPRADLPCGVDLPREFAGVRTGRFTNGYNLADIVAQYVGFNTSPPAYLSLTPRTSLDLLRGRVGANYASGGSGILDVTGNGTITMRKQIQFFADTKARMASAGKVNRKRLDYLLSQSLFVFSAGGNDFSAFADGSVAMSEAPAYIANMVATYIKHIKVLYELGARRVGILDVLPIGCVPSVRASMGIDGACNSAANSLARRFNGLLRREMAGAAVAASMPGLRYFIGSVYNAFTDMIANPRSDGLEEVASACCGGGRLNAEVGCSESSNLCADRGGYVFWDKVHGTQAAYQRAVLFIFHGPTRYAEPVSFEHPGAKHLGAAVDLEHSLANRMAGIQPRQGTVGSDESTSVM